MKKIKNVLFMVRIFLRLVFLMVKNYFALNDDPRHNFLICKEICQKLSQIFAVCDPRPFKQKPFQNTERSFRYERGTE